MKQVISSIIQCKPERLFSVIILFVCLFSLNNEADAATRFIKLQHLGTNNEIKPGDFYVKFDNNGLVELSSRLKRTVNGGGIEGSFGIAFNPNCLNTANHTYIPDGKSDDFFDIYYAVVERGTIFSLSAGMYANNECNKNMVLNLENVWIATVGDLQRECDNSSGKTSQHYTRIKINADSNAATPIFDVSLPIIEVRCSDDYQAGKRPATARAFEFTHDCEEGFYIQGTDQNMVRSPYPTRPKCMRLEDAQNSETAHDKIPVGDKACPFIYTQAAAGGEWLEQGTILTYHNGKKTERTQVKDLTAFAGKVLIREIDPETSYIDSLSVILFYPDGRKAVLAPDREELNAIDGRYLVTEQGDEVEVTFQQPADWVSGRVEITAHGYYEPY